MTKRAAVFRDPDWGRTSNRLLSIPATAFAALPSLREICGLDCIFTVSGVARAVSTEPPNNHLQNERPAFDYF